MTGGTHMSVDTSQTAVWRQMQAERTAASSNDPELLLYGGGGGGPMDSATKDYVDARDDAVESRLGRQLDKVATKGTIWTAVASGIGILAALLAYGGDRFDGGVSVSPTMAKIQNEQLERDKKQDVQLELIEQKIDILIKQSSN